MTTNTFTEMSLTEWIETYKPIHNPRSQDDGFWGAAFETFGEDIDYLKTHDANRIWTLINGDGVHMSLENGIRWVDRLNYFVTEVPFDGEVSVPL